MPLPIETIPKETTSQTVEVKPEVKKEPDLITRVSNFKAEPIIKPIESNDSEFDFKDIDTIADPSQKEIVKKIYKSFERGYGKKFQELAELRKAIEVQKREEGWSPARIQDLLQNPEFIQAAQSVIGTTPIMENETISPIEKENKQKIQSLEAELNKLKQNNFQSVLAQQDSELKTKYANYNPQAIDTLTSDMIANKVQATREHLWKVLDYEDAVNRAYELGKQDGSGKKQEKIQSLSVEGATTVKADGALNPEKGESDRNFFRRLVLDNINKTKTEQIRK